MTDTNDAVPNEGKAARRKTSSRRKFLKRLGLGVGAVLAGGIGDALFIEPRWPRVSHPVVTIPSLGAAWDGVRLAQLTDLHLGRFMDVDYVRDVVALALAQSPDVVVLTGDYATSRRMITPAYSQALTPLKAPLGQFAVLGNHDLRGRPRRVEQMLANAGIQMLTNTHVLLERDGETLCIAGVDDSWRGNPDLDAALAGVPEDVPRVLLCHNPDYAETLPAGRRVDLMLCGHTHGGQVNIPLLGRPVLPIYHRKYAAGLNPGPRCPVYTCVGLGMVGVPVRLNCRPELALITLRRQTV